MDKIVENFYKRISDMKENYNEDFLKNKLNSYYESFNIPNLQILYDFSTYFENFFSNDRINNYIGVPGTSLTSAAPYVSQLGVMDVPHKQHVDVTVRRMESRPATFYI